MKICKKNIFLEVWHFQGLFSTRVALEFELFISLKEKLSLMLIFVCWFSTWKILLNKVK
jgi:hypothetical protein